MADVSSGDEIASFNDSDQFDEDSLSLYSWFSEHDSISAITWSGWKRASHTPPGNHNNSNNSITILSLVDTCAKIVAQHFPFQMVEEYDPPVPEQIQLKIAYWSFPRNDNDIHLYSCVAHGTSDEFLLAELILRWKNIRNVLQIGFHLSGMVIGDKFKDEYTIAVTFDRCQIVTCSCSCPATSNWCSHVIALCLFRIRHPNLVTFRAPISESLSRLKRDQLQKFAQYLINELPGKALPDDENIGWDCEKLDDMLDAFNEGRKHVLPVAQGLLDQLLNDPHSNINAVSGAPDPTAGAGYIDEPIWNLDEESLREKLRKVVGKLCGLSPVAFVDLNPSFFTSSAPTISDEWVSLLRPLTSHEPEAMWNLFEIIRNLLKAQDLNSIQILQIVTEELLNFPQLSLWWFVTSTDVDSSFFIGNSANILHQTHANSTSSGYSNRNTFARLFEEIVELWKTILIVPFITNTNKNKIKDRLVSWHEVALETTRRGCAGREQKFFDGCEQFVGFTPAIKARNIEWKSFLNDRAFHFNVIDHDAGYSLMNQSDNSNSCKPKSEAFPVQDFSIEDHMASLYSCINAFHIIGLSDVARALAAELADKLFVQFATDHCYQPIAVKCAIVCKVLRESLEYQTVAFELGLRCLSMPRKPAKTKLQEVEFTNCEMNLRSALKSMIIGHEELDLIRSTVKNFLTCCYSTEPRSTPFIFVIYVFEVLAAATVQSRTLVKMKNRFADNVCPAHSDNKFAYNFALKALRWTYSASNNYHSMLCESFRHFRNDLAETLLWHFRSSEIELKEILSHLLKLENYIPGLLAMRSTGPMPICVKNEDPMVISKDTKPVRSTCDPTAEVRNVSEGELNSRMIAFETGSITKDCEKDIAVTDDGGDKATFGNRQFSNGASEITQHCSADTAAAHNICVGRDGKEKEYTDSAASGTPKEKLGASSISCEITATDTMKCGQDLGKESGASCITDEILADKAIVLNMPCNNNCQHEQSSSNSKYDEIDLHFKDGENFLLSGSIDGRNTWDPAISWAETSTPISLACQSDYYNKIDVSPDNGMFPIDMKRNIDKVRLECDSYALFELAKEVLSRSLDESDEQDSTTTVRPHKKLQLTAFEISIFSLRLHNFISPKWLSRTYSSHVSWVADKCIDIGYAAIHKLNDSWEDVLTPSEVIDISSRASKSSDYLLQVAAAELAVSSLAHSHTLNPGEIQQAINLCKEQNIELLERACTFVEKSSRNGGILPEILFYIARQWQYMHEKFINHPTRTPKKAQTMCMKRNCDCRPTVDKREHACSSSKQCYHVINEENLPKVPLRGILNSNSGKSVPDLQLEQQAQHSYNPTMDKRHQLDRSNISSVCHDFPNNSLVTAEQFVQQQMHRMAEEILKRNLTSEHVSSKLKPSSNAPARFRSQLSAPLNHAMVLGKASSAIYNTDRASKSDDSEASAQLQAAFRVGIKALEALARKGNEERADLKFAHSPPCSDDIRWLCALTASLGPTYLRKFCKTVILSVSSPFVLHDLALEAARHFAMYNPAQLASYLRSPAVSPIVNRCLTMYSELVRRDLALLNQSGYPSFVELLRKARSAFCMAPGGMIKFNELLEIIRKSCPRKGDLWQHIMNGLSRA